MLFLQNWISSFRSDGVVDVLGTEGGARRGETWPGGKTSCRVGGTAAARTTVNCSGETRFATSAKPFAAAAEYRWASARLEKTSEISEHVSLSGSFCSGILLTRLPRILSKVGTVHCSSTSFGCSLSGQSISLKRRS